MEKAIESDISRRVVNADVEGVVIDQVPIAGVDVPMVVEVVVDPSVVGVNVDQVKGEIHQIDAATDITA